MSSISVLRQSAAELLALVVIDLFPGAILAESVATEFGFYCDIIATQPIDDYALPLLEEKMRAFAKQNIEVRTLDMMREVAAHYLEHKGQPLRGQAVGLAKENIVSLIQIGDFCDYCPLPYIIETQEVEFFKLFKVEKAIYHIPEEGSVEVKRIHGTVSNDKQSLKKLVKALQTGKKADHTNLPKEMELFSFHEEISEMGWIWRSNGLTLRKNLVNWWENEHQKQEFQLVSTPSVVKEALTKKVGVYDSHFSDFKPPVFNLDDSPYVLSPSPVSAHMVLYKQKSRSIRELPIRYAECAPIVFTEKKGSLGGIFDSQLVSADFAYIFCAAAHLEGEIISSLQFIDKIIKIFGFEYYWYFKGRGQKFAGTVNRWEKSQNSLDSAFRKCGFAYITHPQESAFAGPIIEAQLIDSFGREWKGPTIALDFNAPDRFGLRYQAGDDKTHVPLMIVRSIAGSFERLIALLLEHTSGFLPLWLAPEQIRVLPVKEEYDAYAKTVSQILNDAGCRAKTDYGHEQIGKKIAKAENEKIPYLIIVGEKEKNDNLITLRFSGRDAHQQLTTVEAFLKLIHEEVSMKVPREKPR